MRRDLYPFLLGFLATSGQIWVLREFSAYFYGNELTFGIVLASWLLWGGLGSLAASRKKPLSSLGAAYLPALVGLPLVLAGVRFSRFLFHLLPGELVGASAVVLASVLLCLLIGFPLGALFAWNVAAQKGDIARVYMLESLGASAAGPAVQLCLVPFVSSWVAASALGIVSVLLLGAAGGLKRPFLWGVPLLLFFIVFGLADLPLQRFYWKPFRLIQAEDTRYGKLQLIRTEEQLSLYANGSHVYSYPDQSASEESVHFAGLQAPQSRSALLLGGGAGGALGELLKYPGLEIDYVELDPGIIRLSRLYLDEEEKRTLADRQVHLFAQDGRSFLRQTKKRYDLIILNLPEPATAQLNRYYTLQFIQSARDHLEPGGIYSFAVPSAENYIGPELQNLLSSLYATASRVFPQVLAVPGDRSVFLASDRPLTLDAEELGRRVEDLGLKTTFVHPQNLVSRLHPLRLRYLEEKLITGTGRLNTDLFPVSFFLQGAFWGSQFRGLEARSLKFLSTVPPSWLLLSPLFLVAVLLLYLRVRRKSASFILTPLWIMGLTTIVAEIAVLLWFQSLYGYLYGRIALLLSTFMLGLFFGSLISSRSKAASFPGLLRAQTGFLALILGLELAIKTRPPESLAFALLFLFGVAGGDLFIVSNRLYLREKLDYGKGYALDLGGSFVGALATSSILVPLAGLPRVLEATFLLNLLGVLFLLARPKNR